MPTVTRAQVLTVLQQDWGAYVPRFQSLPPETQAEVLRHQGYARLADLLAHIIAWWREGQQMVAQWLLDPTLEEPHYDVDAFNAQAVARFAQADEADVLRTFEETRLAWLALVNRLPNEFFNSPKQADRLHIEIIGHLAEHALP